MVQRNLKKLLFLMLLMLGVGQAAQATKVYADLAKVTDGNSQGKWNLETKTFTWDAQQNRRILLTGLPDFSEFEYLVLDIQSATGAFRVDFEIPNFDDDNTASYLPGTQFDVTEEAQLLQIPLSELTLTSEQLSSITGVRINANSPQGEVVLNGVYLERKFELVFDEMGKAYIYPSDMTVTGEGMTLDSQTGILTKNAEGAASLTVEFGDVDFSNVTNIDVDVDRTTAPYIDLLAETKTGNGQTELNKANENIVNWTYSKYNYTLDDDLQANAHNVKSFVLNMNPTLTGSMKINNICITKEMLSVLDGGEVILNSLTYYRYDGNEAEQNKPFDKKDFQPAEGGTTWNMNTRTDAFYGDCNGVQQQKSYVNLDDYDELRLYMTDKTSVRCWFIANDFSATVGEDGSYSFSESNIVTVYLRNGNDEGKDYATVDLAQVKTENNLEHAYLIGIKTEGWQVYTTLRNITVYDKDADNPADYVISGRGEVTPAVQAALDNATVIDATGITKATTLNSANPNCLFIANKYILNPNNVLVKGEDDTYTCAKLVLETGKPFRAPFEFTATSASMKKTISNQFATLILPYNATVPKECEAYTLTGVDENNVVEGESLGATIPANTPVLLANAGEYDFNAKNVTVPVTPAELTEGLLTGVYSATQAPTNSYVLQTQEGGQAFYHATEGNEPTMNPFTAYLTYTASNNANKLIFDLGGEVTSVENVEAATSAATVVEIYDLSGRQVSAPVKGINLMKMSDGTVKKVIVK